MRTIGKAAVFGAGVMGSGIAAHIANAGVPVLLFDVASSDRSNRSGIAANAISRLAKSDPAALMHDRNSALIAPCNIEDDLHRLAECDWIIEAIIEKADAKQALYRKIDSVRRPLTIVSSNTSTIPLSALTQGLDRSFASDFLVTHFFNPPRYQRLLEIVPGEQTRAEAIESIETFADLKLGKTPVRCKDTPGFIANRIGIYWLQCAVLQAIALDLTVEEADAVMGTPIGAPKTGVFGLLDMVGIDLMPHVMGSMAKTLPKTDSFHDVQQDLPLIRKMIESGHIGRKGKGGFYRLKPDTAEKIKEALDLSTGTYRATRKPSFGSLVSRRGGLRALLEHPDKGGRYAWSVLSRTLTYTASVVPEIADEITAVDTAMRLGYNWKRGPFELIDHLGVDWFIDKLRRSGMSPPPLLARARGRRFYRVERGQRQYLKLDGTYADITHRPGVILLADIKRMRRPLKRNPSASLWDIGDNVLCLEFHSKMNALDPLSLFMINKALRLVAAQHRALVIYNEEKNFSVGANIGLLSIATKLRAWFLLRLLIRYGQKTLQRMKYAPFPVVAAPSGMAMGGGCEILLHSSAVQADAETYAGLVEAGVGLVPAWGGCKELLCRRASSKRPPFGPMPAVINTFETIGLAKVATSAERAKDLMFLRPSDGITMNRDRLLADAKNKALNLSRNYEPLAPLRISLPGRTAFAALSLALANFRRLGKATPHDVVIGKHLARIVSGGNTDITETLDEEDLLSLEAQAFLALARQPASAARVTHMLSTGKPLRN
ncbi:MAG TPA: 3-hydroxyacyl-CoA dehydrogenase NAD-binding domain-containing protein [Aestuariivirgaceae bacterium]